MKKALFVLIVLPLFLTSCKKDKTGNVDVVFEHLWEGVGLEYNKPYAAPGNDTVWITELRYYISNIKLVRDDNSIWEDEDGYYLVDHTVTGSKKLPFSEIPEGKYKKLSFLVGVDSVRNYSGAQVGALDPSKGMFWSWNSGYIFFKLEGDASGLASPGVFRYHIGGFTAPLIGSRTVEIDFSGGGLAVSGKSDREVHLTLNLRKFFNGVQQIDLSVEPIIMAPSAQAVKVADNIQSMFELEDIH